MSLVKVRWQKAFAALSVVAVAGCQTRAFHEAAETDEGGDLQQVAAGVSPCGSPKAGIPNFVWAANPQSVTLSTEETGGRNGVDQPNSSQTSRNYRWTVQADDFVSKLEEEGIAKPDGKHMNATEILWAECNPRTGKTIVAAAFGDQTVNGRRMGLFVAHAKWGTVEVFTMPTTDGTRQIYVPWGQQPNSWTGGNHPLNQQWRKANPNANLVKLQSVYIPDVKNNRKDRMNLHSGFWNIEVPGQVKLPAGVKACRPPTAVSGRPAQFAAGQMPKDGNGRATGFYFGQDNGVRVRHCDDNGNYATVEFTPVLEFVKCTPSSPAAERLCAGAKLLAK